MERPLLISDENPMLPGDVGRYIVKRYGQGVHRICGYFTNLSGVEGPRVSIGSTMYRPNGSNIYNDDAIRFATPEDHCKPLTTDDLLDEIQRRTGVWMGPTRDVIAEKR